MTDLGAARSDLAQVLGRFPQAAPLIRRLALADQSFRSLCEDYTLARDTLARFQAMPDAQQRPEIAEYLPVIAEIESEIIGFVQTAQGSIETPIL